MDGFIDTESHSGGSNDNVSFQVIVLKHLHSISTLASVELRGGYWQKKSIPVAGTVMTSEEYIPDTRERYSNAVLHLHDLLMPYFDESMKIISTTCDTDIKALKKDDEEYRDDKFSLCRPLFQQLSTFMKRNNYLNAKDFEVSNE